MPPSQICFKTILRIFDGFEYSTNFFCQKVKKSSNIRSHRIFEKWSWKNEKSVKEYENSNIRNHIFDNDGRICLKNFLKIFESNIRFWLLNKGSEQIKYPEIFSLLQCKKIRIGAIEIWVFLLFFPFIGYIQYIIHYKLYYMAYIR